MRTSKDRMDLGSHWCYQLGTDWARLLLQRELEPREPHLRPLDVA